MLASRRARGIWTDGADVRHDKEEDEMEDEMGWHKGDMYDDDPEPRPLRLFLTREQTAFWRYIGSLEIQSLETLIRNSLGERVAATLTRFELAPGEVLIRPLLPEEVTAAYEQFLQELLSWEDRYQHASLARAARLMSVHRPSLGEGLDVSQVGFMCPRYARRPRLVAPADLRAEDPYDVRCFAPLQVEYWGGLRPEIDHKLWFIGPMTGVPSKWLTGESPWNPEGWILSGYLSDWDKRNIGY
jgi:hypothetical protein